MAVVKLNPDVVKRLFDTAKHQNDYIEGIYKMVFSDWDRIKSIERWPSCNNATWSAICILCQNWDKLHLDDVLPGGAWLNTGFSGSNKELALWEVDTNTCEVTYKE